jgi:glycogen debranching enzyme
MGPMATTTTSGQTRSLPSACPIVRSVRTTQASVVRVCRRHLLTAFGLRSLAPGSSEYHPGYGGGVSERDGGYHEGPVWAWLLGPFCLAAYRVSGDFTAAQALLERISDALEDQGLGTIGEIFEGDPPHRPRGAPAQAWSVACTLDAWRVLRQAQQTKQT